MRQTSFLLPLLVLASIAIAIVLLSWQDSILVPKVTAVVAEGDFGAYWDPAATNSCQSIHWGQLDPGSRKTVVVYLKNEGNESIFYLLTTKQWYPANASNYIALESDYDGTRESPGSVRPVSLTLLISREIRGIADFSFDIVIQGSRNPFGDIDGDGKVDGKDIAAIAKYFGYTSEYPPNTDVNNDGKIDGNDIAIVAKNFGKA